MWGAIRELKIRGAPALGIAAAFGTYLGIKNSPAKTFAEFKQDLDQAIKYLGGSRPTAYNLFWAMERIKGKAEELKSQAVEKIKEALLEEAINIQEEDERLCESIGEKGAEIIQEGNTILTHCNAGGLATSGYGTALAVIFKAKEAGKKIKVYADETRPLLQGARLTAWELQQEGIEVILICDNMAGEVMREGKIDQVIVGADRIAMNGDTANKIGTYSLAVLAKHHQIPFYIAAPSSTFDPNIEDGHAIPIEERAPQEITCWGGRTIAPKKIKVYNPAFDVTPHDLITGIITEVDIIYPPFQKSIHQVIDR